LLVKKNIELPYGQHRWVEYADIHNPDPTMITPEWHGWMHHTFDETPDEVPNQDGLFEATAQVSHAPYNTHLAKITDTTSHNFPSTNLSQFR
jgi:NADH:ubiquinone oxidoreductase subunit